MKKTILLVLALFISAPGCSGPKTVQKTESIMGTDVTITVVARTVKDGEAAIDAGMAELRRLDAMMSLYKDSSDHEGEPRRREGPGQGFSRNDRGCGACCEDIGTLERGL